MKTLTKLIDKAAESCKFRGHQMLPFEKHQNWARSECKICRKAASVITNPLPNEIDIGGEAVAIGCAN